MPRGGLVDSTANPRVVNSVNDKRIFRSVYLFIALQWGSQDPGYNLKEGWREQFRALGETRMVCGSTPIDFDIR